MAASNLLNTFSRTCIEMKDILLIANLKNLVIPWYLQEEAPVLKCNCKCKVYVEKN